MFSAPWILPAAGRLLPTADARQKLLGAGLDEEAIDGDGELKIDFSEMATEYFVRCVPGSLVEMEDEKQMRILNQLFIPLSQAMPALAATQDQALLQNAAATMQFIVQRQLELSGSNSARELKSLFTTGKTESFNEYERKTHELENSIGGVTDGLLESNRISAEAIAQLQNQISLLRQTQEQVFKVLGVPTEQSAPAAPNPEGAQPPVQGAVATV